ncbi:MAG: PD-(D/E)XK nuclease family protein [Acidimicrobiales bacterium]
MSAPRNASAEIGKRRAYTYGGKTFPSVTTILGLGRPKEWMGAWAAKEVAQEAEAGVEAHGPGAIQHWVELDRATHAATKTHIERHKTKCPHVPSALGYLKGTPWRKRDLAADTGSSIHDVLEAMAHEQPIPDDAPFAAYLSSWRDAYRPRILESEAQVVSIADGYAGSLDLIADVYGRRLIIDLKTSKLLDGQGRPKNVSRDWCLQLAAYRYAERIFEDDRSWEMTEVEGAAVLWIPQDVPDEWKFIEVPAAAPEYRAFLAAKATHDDHRKYEKESLGTLILPRALEAA